jgi:hypothetical protein
MPKRPSKEQRQKNALKEAFKSLGIKGKRQGNPITTARFLGFTPLRRGVPLNPADPAFARQVNNEVFRRYANATQRVSQTITIHYKYRYKKTDPKTKNKLLKGVLTQTITGTRNTIDKIRTDMINELYDDLDTDSPFIIEEVGEAQVSTLQKLPVGAGGRFISKGIRAVRMKRVGALKLDYDFIGDMAWDREENTCVFDYLYSEYKNIKGFKKFLPSEDREVAYDNLNQVFKTDEDDDPLTDGVNIDQVAVFADKFNIPMMAFDKNKKKIVCFRPEKINKDAKPIMFIIANTHFYPIVDKHERASLSAKVREDKKEDSDRFNGIKNWKSEDFEIAPKEETEEGAEPPPPIYPSDDDPIGNEFVMKIIKETKTIPRKLQVEGSKVVRFSLGEQKYYTEQQTDLDKKVETYIRESGELYWGQSPNFIMSEIFKEVYEVDFYKVGNSRFNPAVYDLLMDAKVKYRQHYGATKDNTELLKLVEEEFEEVIEEKEIETTYKDIFTGEPRIKKDKIKLRTKVAKPRMRLIDKKFENGEAVCYDLNKHYTSCLLNPYDEFLMFDEEDTIRTFKQDISKPLQTGIYYVETNDLSLLHQSNWYSNKIIDLALQEGIELTIKYELLPVERYEVGDKLLPKEYFKKFIDKAYETPFGKDLVNIFIGCLGKTTQQSKIVECDTDADLVWDCFVNCETPKDENDYEHLFFKEEYEDNYNRLNKKNIILQNIHTEEEPLYLYGHNSIQGQNEISLPIWIQLLDWSNMRLYNMSKKVGGEIIFRKTDCIVSLGGKVGLSQEGFDNFKSAEWEHLKLTSPQKTDRHYASWNWRANWLKYDKFKTSSDWENIIELAKEKGGLLIEGRAGTGKSYIPKKAFETGLLKLNNDTITMSFTNKASRNIQGKTIHKTLNITKNNTIPKKTMDSLRKYKYFVVDEIGMISPSLWRLLKLVKQSHPQSIWILMGDYRQLPPIEDNQRIVEKLDIFNLPIVKYIANYNKIELTEKQRYDEFLWDYLEEGYNNKNWKDLPSRAITPDEIYNNKAICYYNKTRDLVNNECMAYFKTQAPNMLIEYERKDDDDKPNSIWIYEGLPVMAYKNCKDLEIVNSEEFIVIAYDENNITLKRDVDDLPDVEVDVEDFHNYFVCNYCSTTHKSQGATYQGKIILFNWDRLIADRNVAYTACSRATALRNLVVAESIVYK